MAEEFYLDVLFSSMQVLLLPGSAGEDDEMKASEGGVRMHCREDNFSCTLYLLHLPPYSDGWGL